MSAQRLFRGFGRSLMLAAFVTAAWALMDWITIDVIGIRFIHSNLMTLFAGAQLGAWFMVDWCPRPHTQEP